MNDRRPILILGSTGLLGEALAAELEQRGRAFFAPTRDRFDLLRPDTLRPLLSGWSPGAVINAAAYSDVAGAESPSTRDEVFRMNRDGPGALAEACQALSIPLVHVSTDYVFDGERSIPYVESDAVRPLQVYGESKLEGERLVLAACPGAIVARTSTLFGPGRVRRQHYVSAILRQARERPRIEVVRLPVSSPAYTPDLAAILLDLLDRGATGIVHAANRGECSRLEFARAAVRLAGPSFSCEVVERPAPPGDLKRPSYSVLDPTLCEQRIGREIRPWVDALAEYLERNEL